MITPTSARSPYILPWLYLCMAMVVLMVFVGGITRLTESGLSIVEWELFRGVIPPLSEADWQDYFAQYQQSPEFVKVNASFALADFKTIFWLEWIHRLLGRATGLIFLVPLMYFALRGQMDKPLIARSVTAGVLVAAQGLLGWVMVQSGLVDDPRVHPVKLAMHLSLAFIVFCYLLWTALGVRGAPRILHPQRAWAIRGITALVFIQIIFGALVAGLDAGFSYNTWPLMDGDVIPRHLMMLEPWYANFTGHIVMVQWQHRMMAYIVAGAIALYVFIYRKHHPAPRMLYALLGALAVQFLLGVATLVMVVPLSLACAHQMVALLLLGLCVREVYGVTVRKHN